MKEAQELHQPVRPPKRTQWQYPDADQSSTGSVELDQMGDLIRQRMGNISREYFDERHHDVEEIARSVNPGLQFTTDFIYQNIDTIRSILNPYTGHLHSTHGIVLHTWEHPSLKGMYHGIILGTSQTSEFSPPLYDLQLDDIHSPTPIEVGIVKTDICSYPYKLRNVTDTFEYQAVAHIVGIGPYQWKDKVYKTSDESLCAWRIHSQLFIERLRDFGLTVYSESTARESFFKLQNALT